MRDIVVPFGIGASCACIVDEDGLNHHWMPCPYRLCEREDHFHDAELAWSAGFFDGEGSTGLDQQLHHGSPALRVQISQKDERPLLRFAAAVGAGRLYHNRLHTLVAAGADGITVLEKLWPYLSEPKREQARSALTEARARRSTRYPKLTARYDEAADFMGVSR